MDFRYTTIPPEGRNKYGNYLSSGNITKMVVSYENNGNGSNGGDNGGGETIIPPKNYTITLARNTGNFEWTDILSNGKATDDILVMGYGEGERVPVFVGDISITPETESDVASNRNYDVKGLVNGMHISVTNNGTTEATITISIDKNIPTTNGVIYIPCNVYLGPANRAPYVSTSGSDDIDKPEDYSDWNSALSDCKTIWLEYSYLVVMTAGNSYHLELSNEIAGLNCDSSGYPMAGVSMPTCTAQLYFGDDLVENANYSITYDVDKGVTGLSCNSSTGELTFGSDFYFIGSMLEITVMATDKDKTSTKIMTINKVYSGADGTPATTKWIIPSVSVIKYDQETDTLSPSTISAKVMKQEGGEPIVEDTTEPIYWGWDTENPTSTYNRGNITVDASKSYIAFALKNSNGIYEKETVSIIYDGTKGENGDNGNGIVSTTIEYGLSDNDTTQPSWSTTVPTLVKGKYLWTKITWSYSDGTTKESIQKTYISKDGLGISSTTIEYGLSNELTEPSSWYSSVPSLVKGQYLWTRITWLYTDGSRKVTYQKTYIPKDGETGPQGRNGAAIRGPVDWKAQTSSRLWCDGKGAANTENGEFIDVVVFNGTYYKCHTSYEGAGSETSAPSSTYWTATDKQYEFVSTNLLLADNAKIKFATNNELYLTDNNGNVTAGAKGGNDVNYWAGSSQPSNAPFKVNYEGEMTASKGTFGILSITTDSDGDACLKASQYDEDTLCNLQLTAKDMRFTANGELVKIGYIGAGDSSAWVEAPTIAADDYVIANSFVKQFGGIRMSTPFCPVQNLQFNFIDNTNSFTQSGEQWYWRNMPTGISTSSFPSISTDGNGRYVYVAGVNTFPTGIVTPNVTKENGIIYIDLTS